MKKVSLFLAAALIICFACLSCSKEDADRLNAQMIEYVNSQEHDSDLCGWWSSVRENNVFACYDGVSFKVMKASRNTSGEVVVGETYKYWYTKDNVLYTRRKATKLTGIIEGAEKYQISSDGKIFQVFDEYSGTYVDSFQKCEKPE